MATHIQIGDDTPRVQYEADGTQKVFTYTFPIFENADLEVYLDGELTTTPQTFKPSRKAAAVINVCSVWLITPSRLAVTITTG